MFKTRSRSDSIKLSKKLKPFCHSEKTKRKISEIRKEYIKNNPDKLPYLSNHRKYGDSYPEQYFETILINNNIIYTKKYRISIYELDFAIVDKKINIEVDGSQHYNNIKVIESDKRRNEFLKSDGWDIIRINWSEYLKSDKEKYIIDLINYINNITNNKPVTQITKQYTKYDYCSCGNLKWKSSNNCRECYIKSRQIVVHPTYEELLLDISQSNYVAVGKKYGVSDNTIRKWIRKHLN